MAWFKRVSRRSGKTAEDSEWRIVEQSESISTFAPYPQQLMKIGQLGTGFGDDASLGATEEAWGLEAGGAGVPTQYASGPGTPGPLYAQSVGDARAGTIDERIARMRVALDRTVAQAPRKAHAAQVRADACRRKIDELVQRRTERLGERDDHDRERDQAQRAYDALPRAQQGVVDQWWQPALVAVGVSLIDVGVLHLAFASSAVDETSVWLNSIFIPLAILGMMFAFGWLSGLIGLALPQRWRLPLAIAALAVALLTVFFGLTLLTIFRDNAVEENNQMFKAVGHGGGLGALQLVLKTTFLGPLQGAAVCAGTFAEALYIVGRPGRAQRAKVKAAIDRMNQANEEIAEYETQIAELEADESAALAEVPQAEADGEAAAGELKHVDAIAEAQRKAQRGATDAAAARYEMERLIADQKARNGAVRLATVQSMQQDGVWVSPSAQYIPQPTGPRPPEPEPEPEPDRVSTNGDG